MLGETFRDMVRLKLCWARKPVEWAAASIDSNFNTSTHLLQAIDLRNEPPETWSTRILEGTVKDVLHRFHGWECFDMVKGNSAVLWNVHRDLVRDGLSSPVTGPHPNIAQSGSLPPPFEGLEPGYLFSAAGNYAIATFRFSSDDSDPGTPMFAEEVFVCGYHCLKQNDASSGSQIRLLWHFQTRLSDFAMNDCFFAFMSDDFPEKGVVLKDVRNGETLGAIYVPNSWFNIQIVMTRMHLMIYRAVPNEREIFLDIWDISEAYAAQDNPGDNDPDREKTAAEIAAATFPHLWNINLQHTFQDNDLMAVISTDEKTLMLRPHGSLGDRNRELLVIYHMTKKNVSRWIASRWDLDPRHATDYGRDVLGRSDWAAIYDRILTIHEPSHEIMGEGSRDPEDVVKFWKVDSQRENIRAVLGLQCSGSRISPI